MTPTVRGPQGATFAHAVANMLEDRAREVLGDKGIPINRETLETEFSAQANKLLDALEELL